MSSTAVKVAITALSIALGVVLARWLEQRIWGAR